MQENNTYQYHQFLSYQSTGERFISLDDSKTGDLGDAKVWKEAGNAHFHKGDYEAAQRCYAQAIELDPAYEAAWNNLGLSLLKLGKIEEARQVNERLKILREKKADAGTPPGPPSPDPSDDSGEAPAPRKKPILAAILSFIIPGLGQVYNREYLKGILFFIFTIIGSIFLVIPGLIIWIAGIYDAYRTAKQINSGEILSKSIRQKNTALLFGATGAIFSLIILVAFIYGMSGPVPQSVAVIVTPTQEGMEITWNGGMDFDSVTGWKVFEYTSGKELLIMDGTGNIPVIGQTNTYSGGSISGKRIVIRTWFSDGTEQVVYDRKF